MTDLEFDVSGLREQGMLEFARQVEPAVAQPLLAGAAVLTGPLEVQLRVVRNGSGASFSGTVEGGWEFACVRCLEPARLRFRAGVEGSVAAGQNVLDVSEEMRQALSLALPERARCREDCKGLCPRCGANRNAGDCGCPPEGPAPYGRGEVVV